MNPDTRRRTRKVVGLVASLTANSVATTIVRSLVPPQQNMLMNSMTTLGSMSIGITVGNMAEREVKRTFDDFMDAIDGPQRVHTF